MSLFDRMKDKLDQAGKGAQKLARMGQLKLEITSAETRLADAHKSLGKACASRFLERREPIVEREEPVITQCLADIERALAHLAELRTEYEQLRKERGEHGDG